MQFDIHFLLESNGTIQNNTSEDHAYYIHFNADKHVVVKALNLDIHWAIKFAVFKYSTWEMQSYTSSLYKYISS